jgi:hypothetical protein
LSFRRTIGSTVIPTIIDALCAYIYSVRTAFDSTLDYAIGRAINSAIKYSIDSSLD